MLYARLLRWAICFALVVLCIGVAAQEEETKGTQKCDWYCAVEERIDWLHDQVLKITKVLFPQEKDDEQPDFPHEHDTTNKPTETRYPSTFGTPYVQEAVPTSTPSKPSTRPKAKPDVAVRDGYRAVGYYGNWDIYARKFFPWQIPAAQLTHLMYSFADIKDDGTVFLTDTYADTDIHYAGDSWSESGKNVYGAVKQLQILKAANRNLKVILSVGGWTYTNTNKHMDTPMATEAGRTRFAESCVELIRDYGFDGIDVDWEYPVDTKQGGQLLALLKTIRQKMNEYADTLVYGDDDGYETKPHFSLSIAAPAGEQNYRYLPLKKIAEVLDFVNLMAYDYAGSWDKTSGHSSNLYPSRSSPISTPFNTVGVINAYLAAGVPSRKINLGAPLYGHAFMNTKGLGKPYDGLGDGSWEKGIYDFNALPLAGAKEFYDQETGATYSYDQKTGMLVSYDTVAMALRKVEYIKKTQLGGMMWWEVSGDKQGEKGIISNVVKGLGGKDGSGIESRSNWLAYPDSQFDNIKNGLAG